MSIGVGATGTGATATQLEEPAEASSSGSSTATAEAPAESSGTGATEGASEDAAAAAPPADPTPLERDAARVLAGAVGLQRVQGSLVVDGITADDPKQGMIGDCYLIATMSALAHAAPERIRELLRDNGDGTVTVRFAEVGKDATLPREVTVDLDLLVHQGDDAGRPVYADSHDRDAAGKPELWPAIIEKAYAQLKGSYQDIGYGGLPSDALEALTGVKAELDSVGARVDDGDRQTAANISALFKGAISPEAMLETLAKKRAEHGEAAWTWLRDGTAAGMPVVAATYGEADLLRTGLLPFHAYAVLGVEERDGQRFVTLRNPAPYMKEMEDPSLADEIRKRPDLAALADMFTSQGIAPKDLSYGTFSLPWEDFRRCFVTATRTPLGGAPQPTPAAGSGG